MTDTTTDLPVVEPKVRVFRVLKAGAYVDGPDGSEPAAWDELGTLSDPYMPDAQDIGEKFGAGDFLLIEKESKYSHAWTYEVRVVAKTYYQEARDDDEAAA